jgi:hypothetical protein
MSLANIMIGAAKDPDKKAKLASLSVRNVRSSSRSPVPSKSPSIAEEDPLDRFKDIASARKLNEADDSESSDEIHSDDSSDDADKDSEISDSDDSEKRRERKKNSRSSSTGSGSVYDKIKLGIKATRRGFSPSPTPSPTPTSMNLQPPNSNSDPQISPISAKMSKPSNQFIFYTGKLVQTVQV